MKGDHEMLFNSYQFIVFLPIVVLGFYICPPKLRRVLLLGASYFFYMCWEPIYALLILFITIVSYFVGLALDRKTATPEIRKIILAAGCIIAILLLGYFKYYNFLVGNVNRLAKFLGIPIKIAASRVLLPVGVSFYTFQAIGYCVDVYRGTTECEKNPITFALFISFFPQLVAGPIERSSNLLRQLRNTQSTHAELNNFAYGFIMVLYGLFLKMVLADRLAIVADNVFDNYFLYDSIELIIASIAFSFQIYCDFSSYSIIATGAARMLGITLIDNFRCPYFSRSIREFWQRWHISLSSWLRDYVYIPLGGNRRGEKTKNRNLLITFLVSGIWHGASWTYIIWGVLHGAIQIAQDGLGKIRRKLGIPESADDRFSANLAKQIGTFVIVDVLWIFFRAPSMKSAVIILTRIFTRFNPWVLSNGSLYNLGLSRPECLICLLGFAVLFCVDLVQYRTGKQLPDVLLKEQTWFRWCVVFFLLFAILIWGKYGSNFDAKQFIYFQF